MWDYHNDKLLQTLVIQYEFDFQKVADFLNKNINSCFDEEKCRQRYTEIYANKQKGNIQMSPLQKLILQKNNLQKQQSQEKDFDFNLFHSQLQQQEQERIQKLSELQNQQTQQGEIYEKNFMSQDYVQMKQEKEQQFLENLQKNLSQIEKDNFQIFYLEQDGNQMAIKTADYNSKQGKVQRQKLLDSVQKYQKNFDKEFEKIKGQENLPIPSKYKLFSNLQPEKNQ